MVFSQRACAASDPSCFPKGKISGGTLLQKSCPPDPLPKHPGILAGCPKVVRTSGTRQLVNISNVFGGGARIVRTRFRGAGRADGPKRLERAVV